MKELLENWKRSFNKNVNNNAPIISRDYVIDGERVILWLEVIVERLGVFKAFLAHTSNNRADIEHGMALLENAKDELLDNVL